MKEGFRKLISPGVYTPSTTQTPVTPLKANGVEGGAFEKSYSRNFDSTAYGVGVAVVVVSKDGCGRRNDLFRRLGWLSEGRGNVGVETICFDGFRKYL